MPERLTTHQRRADILRGFGAQGSALEELLQYNQNHFQLEMAEDVKFPLPDEASVSCWAQYAASNATLWNQLIADFPQLSFPVATGTSNDPAYLSATRSGNWQPSNTALGIAQPESLELIIYPTPAGSIPVLVTTVRRDFELLVQALSKRNEAGIIQPSMGACMIAGLNNWGRVRRYRHAWQAGLGDTATEDKWKEEMQVLIAEKDLYQDRLILLSDGPYSGISAQDMQLSEATWRSYSLLIRWGHECAHYFTRRVLGSMRNNLFDELIADYCGIRKATGHFESSWFLRFMGLEDYPAYRPGGRFENYCIDPPLSTEAVSVLKTLLYRAAKNLEEFDRSFPEVRTERSTPGLLALASATLEELAEEGAPYTLAVRVAASRTIERISVQ